MQPPYEKPIEVSRRPRQRRIEVYSPKLKRRATLFSWAAHDAWLLLEADPARFSASVPPIWKANRDG